MKSVDAMSTAMKDTTKAMVRMNKKLNMPELSNILRNFGVEAGKLETTTDMMGDALDDIFSGDGEEEEEDELMAKVALELSLEFGEKAPVAGSGSLAAAPMIAVAPARVATTVGATDCNAPPPTAPSGGGTSGGGGDTCSSAAPPSDLAARLAQLRGSGSAPPPTSQ